MESRKRAIKSTHDVEESTDDGSNDSDMDESDNEEEVQQENINVEFEAQSPIDSDFHGLKQLLLRLFVLLHLDVSELTDIIVSQKNIGSTIKIVENEEDEVFGIVTILSLKKEKERNCIKDLLKELLLKSKSSKNDDVHAKLELLLREKNIGLLLNERFINIPSQIAVPFHNSLNEEVEDAEAEDGDFSFDYLLLISKTLRPTNNPEDGAGGTSQKSKKKKKKKKRESENHHEEIEYTNIEEEAFFKACELSFDYEVTQATGLAVGGSWNFTDQPMKTFRTVMLIPKQKWKTILKDIEDMN